MARGIIFTVTLLLTFGFTVGISRILIPFLKSKKMGQKILDIGPRWHKSKEGTPTMGGLSFMIASAISLIIMMPIAWHFEMIKDWHFVLFVYVFALVNGLIGITDDLAKFKKKENEGLTAKQKYFLQLLSAAIFLFVGVYFDMIPGKAGDGFYLPFFGTVHLFEHTAIRILYYIVVLIFITGVINAVNLTDGIDGLASSVTTVVGLFFAIASAFFTKSPSALFLSSVLIGSCLGFLVYNFHPAKVFMGDTGSLFLGGMIVGLSFLMGNPLILLLAGLIYIIEAFSVILQVLYFKLTHGKRLFKMSPIHHHFEKCSWSEVKIVSVFSICTLIFSLIALLGCGVVEFLK